MRCHVIFSRSVSIKCSLTHKYAYLGSRNISTTKTHNHVLEANEDNHATCQEYFVMIKPMFCKPMIKVQIPLYKCNGVVLLAIATFWWAFQSSINWLYHGHSEFAWYMWPCRFWKISPNVTFQASNIYSQNEEWELPITFTVIKICNSHLKLPEINVKYFEISVTPFADVTILINRLCNSMYFNVTLRLIFQNQVTYVSAPSGLQLLG